MITFDELNPAKNGENLIPAIIQDDRTLKVLMLGYMNRTAFEQTVASGLVTFFSRTRQTLWVKGETSGNFLHVSAIEPDCDRDTLLIRVIPDGPVCHTGQTACFVGRDSEGFLGRLRHIVRLRHESMPENSYTTRLFRAGVAKVAQKVGEEAVETVIEAVRGDREALIYEASDLMYHYLVMLESVGLSLDDIESELMRRHPEK